MDDDQVLIGDETDDHLIGGAGDDLLSGGGGDDTLTAGAGNDELSGGEGDDELIGGGGSDVLAGGPGDDFLNGGGSGGGGRNAGGSGYDTYVFNFTLVGSTRTFSYDDIAPTQTSGANTNGVWNSYLDGLGEWRAGTEALYGAGADTTTQSVDYTYGAGRTQQTGTATYDDTFTVSTEVLKAEGNDVIAQVNGDDVLDFNISLSQALAHLTVRTVDYSYADGVLDTGAGDGEADTLIEFSGGGGQIVILGTGYADLADLLASGHLRLSDSDLIA